MDVKIMQEITQWAVPYRQPNHVYVMSGDRVLAMSRWGTEEPEHFATPNRVNRGGRKFVEVKKNPWRFDLSTRLDTEEVPDRLAGQIWQVLGSKGNQYSVALVRGRWTCTCAGHGFRGHCRHIAEVSASVQR